MINTYVREHIARHGWRPGTDLENRVCRHLHICGFRSNEVQQQHRAGQYRLDFAWPKIKVALEADGWHHQSLHGAARDGVRDAELRRQGWLILRVHDVGDPDLGEQILRIKIIVRALESVK